MTVPHPFKPSPRPPPETTPLLDQGKRSPGPTSQSSAVVREEGKKRVSLDEAAQRPRKIHVAEEGGDRGRARRKEGNGRGETGGGQEGTTRLRKTKGNAGANYGFKRLPFVAFSSFSHVYPFVLPSSVLFQRSDRKRQGARGGREGAGGGRSGPAFVGTLASALLFLELFSFSVHELSACVALTRARAPFAPFVPAMRVILRGN